MYSVLSSLLGRGWDKVGAHTRAYNRKTICIAFIGTFQVDKPPAKQLCAAYQLLAQGVALGKLTIDYELYGHRQLTSTDSPGDSLFKIIQTWKHWRRDPVP